MLATILHVIASHAISVLMLSVGLQTDRALVHAVPGRRRVLARALATIWIAVPLVALILVTVLRLPPTAATVLLIAAIAPGMPLVMKSAQRAHGDPTTALLVLITTGLTAVVMVPLWGLLLHRLAGYELQVSASSVAILMVVKLVLPFALGRIIRVVSPRVARPLAKLASALFAVAVGAFVIAMLATVGPVLRELSLRIVLAVLVFTVAAAGLGWWAGGPERSQRIAVGIAAALGNPALAITLVAHALPSVRAFPVIATFILLRSLAMLPFHAWLRRSTRARRSRPQRPLASQPT